VCVAGPAAPSFAAPPFVKVRDDLLRTAGGGTPSSIAVSRYVAPPATATLEASAATAVTQARAWYGEALAGGGSLGAFPWADPATIDNTGRVAFFSWVDGVERNQGIFVADTAGALTAIAVGCGQGGGSGAHGTCGDPSPVGGTFGGFFGGTCYAPAMNARGDVLFMADVQGGSTPRGLFLWTRSTAAITKVAAVGDLLPSGEKIYALSHGSLNNAGTAAFYVQTVAGAYSADVYTAAAGALTRAAAVGGLAPGGGLFGNLGREWFGFVDGTEMPVGAPALNDLGQLAYFATSTGTVERGLVLATGAAKQWVATSADATPLGGHYFDFFYPVMNNAGQLAFYADVLLDDGSFSGGWFVGTKAAMRKAVAFFDPLAGGQVLGLAASRAPMTPLDNAGNVAVWTSLGDNGPELILVSHADGTTEAIAKMGETGPQGGTLGMMNAWPSRNAGSKTSFGAFTPGADAGIVSAFLVNGPTTPSCSRVAGGGSPWAALAFVTLLMVRRRAARA
jgi:hypothetical protein